MTFFRWIMIVVVGFLFYGRIYANVSRSDIFSERVFECESSSQPSKYLWICPEIEISGGNGRSYKNGYGCAELFTAFYDSNNQWYPFVDLNYITLFDDGLSAGNFGLGWRGYSPCFGDMLGVNVYYDFRQIPQGLLHQIGVGFEILGPRWDIRSNIYWPIKKDERFVDATIFKFPIDFVAICNQFKGAMWGVDLEVGRCFCQFQCIDLFAGIGPYFYGSRCCQSLVGGAGRIEATFCNCLSLQLNITYDQVFGPKAQGVISFSWPFSPRNCCCDRFFEPPYRNKIIVTEDFTCWETNF